MEGGSEYSSQHWLRHLAPIQPSGSLPDSFSIAASDEVARVGRAFFGMTSGAARSVVLHTIEGRTLVIHPKRPSSAMRRRHEWLGNVKYFVRFYFRHDRVRVAEGYGAGHSRLFRLWGRKGRSKAPVERRCYWRCCSERSVAPLVLSSPCACNREELSALPGNAADHERVSWRGATTPHAACLLPKDHRLMTRATVKQHD